MVSFFFTGSAIIGILVSQFLAGRSDRKGDRKSLIVFAVCWAFSPACCCLEPQLFHSAVCWGVPEQLRLDRQPADVRPCPRACRPHRAGSGDVQLDTARAGVACVGDWPPLAYALAYGFGFTVMYLSAAVAFVVCGAMVWFFLPSMRKEPKVATGTLEAPRRNRRDALLLFIICTLMWGNEQPLYH